MFDLAWQKLVYEYKILLKQYMELYDNNWIQKEWETYIYMSLSILHMLMLLSDKYNMKMTKIGR